MSTGNLIMSYRHAHHHFGLFVTSMLAMNLCWWNMLL